MGGDEEPFCETAGEPVAALREVRKAMTAWLKAARKEKKPIPKPKYRPAIYQAAS